jgi:hypothetical protein
MFIFQQMPAARDLHRHMALGQSGRFYTHAALVSSAMGGSPDCWIYLCTGPTNQHLALELGNLVFKDTLLILLLHELATAALQFGDGGQFVCLSTPALLVQLQTGKVGDAALDAR